MFLVDDKPTVIKETDNVKPMMIIENQDPITEDEVFEGYPDLNNVDANSLDSCQMYPDGRVSKM